MRIIVTCPEKCNITHINYNINSAKTRGRHKLDVVQEDTT